MKFAGFIMLTFEVRFNLYNTLFVTKGAFLHKRFYTLYWSEDLRPMRHYVDRNTTAEDILMSCLYAHETNKMPIAALLPKGKREVFHCGHKLSKHFREKEQIRRDCAEHFYNFFGGFPFLPDNLKFFNLTTNSWQRNHTGQFI